MIGNHVAQRAGGLIEGTAMFDADSFGGGDLYVVDVGTIPERFNNAVRETENHHVLDGFLAEIVIDTIDLLFGEDFLQFLVELNGGGKVVAERFFQGSPTGPSSSRMVPSPIHRALNWCAVTGVAFPASRHHIAAMAVVSSTAPAAAASPLVSNRRLRGIGDAPSAG